MSRRFRPKREQENSILLCQSIGRPRVNEMPDNECLQFRIVFLFPCHALEIFSSHDKFWLNYYSSCAPCPYLWICLNTLDVHYFHRNIETKWNECSGVCICYKIITATNALDVFVFQNIYRGERERNVHFSYSCGIRKKDVQCETYNVFCQEWMGANCSER